MERKMRNYLVFVPAGYRLVLLLLECIATVGIQVWLGVEEFVMVVYIAVILLLLAEMMFDYWLFGALASKNGLQLEYLKTSQRGMPVLKMALWGHMLDQLAAELLIVAVNGGVFWWREGKLFLEGRAVVCCLAMIVLGYFLLVTGTTVSRFFDGFMVSVLTGAAAIVLMLGISALIWNNPIRMCGLILVLTILAITISMRITMKRVKESYYDRTD